MLSIATTSPDSPVLFESIWNCRRAQRRNSGQLVQQDRDPEAREVVTAARLASSHRGTPVFAGADFLVDIARQPAQIRGLVAQNASGPLPGPAAVQFAGFAGIRSSLHGAHPTCRNL